MDPMNPAQHSADLYRILAESALDYIFIIDRNFRILYINKIAARLVGESAESIIGKSLESLFRPDVAARYRKGIERVFASGKGHSAEDIMARGDQTAWLETQVVPIANESGEVWAVMGISRDTTERRKAADELEKMQTRLFEAQKLEAVGTLASGIAHDFNNLLAAIKGFASLAMLDLDAAHPAHENLRQLQLTTDRAGELTHQILDFSRKHGAELKPLSINRIVEKMQEVLRRLIGPGISMKFALDSTLWTVMADAAKIEQIILNLTINARDAIENGGSITIATNNASISDESAFGPNARTGSYAVLSVSDTGKGISEDMQEKIFEPFFTTKLDVGGSGLGLAVVNRIVRQMNGWVRVESRVAHGAVFSIYLPASVM